MDETLTFDELKTYLEKTIHFGKMQTEVREREIGYKIVIWEHDEYELMDNECQSVGNNGDITNPFTLFLDENGTINVIEHTMRLMTSGNKDEQLYILNLINKKITHITK